MVGRTFALFLERKERERRKERQEEDPSVAFLVTFAPFAFFVIKK
jgi:hypothetical protein